MVGLNGTSLSPEVDPTLRREALAEALHRALWAVGRPGIVSFASVAFRAQLATGKDSKTTLRLSVST